MWTNIIGHERQIGALRKSLEEKRLPHAWLFSGIRGIGKRRIAEALAAEILGSPAKVSSRTHPDLFIVEPEKQRLLIGQVRELSQRVQFHPLEAEAKVAIVDDADAMTESAANSMLKLLEEPPTATHFILISAAVHRILPTIRSRCRMVSFSPLHEQSIADYLSGEDGMSKTNAMRMAKLSQGSLGVAKALTPEFVDEVLGRFEALCKCASAEDVCATSELWANEADRVETVLDLLAGWYRDRLRTAVMNGDMTWKMLSHLGMIAAARFAAETTANKQLMFEQLLFSLTR